MSIYSRIGTTNIFYVAPISFINPSMTVIICFLMTKYDICFGYFFKVSIKCLSLLGCVWCN